MQLSWPIGLGRVGWLGWNCDLKSHASSTGGISIRSSSLALTIDAFLFARHVQAPIKLSRGKIFAIMTTLAWQNRDTVRQAAPVPVHVMPPMLKPSSEETSQDLTVWGGVNEKLKCVGTRRKNHSCDKWAGSSQARFHVPNSSKTYVTVSNGNEAGQVLDTSSLTSCHVGKGGKKISSGFFNKEKEWTGARANIIVHRFSRKHAVRV